MNFSDDDYIRGYKATPMPPIPRKGQGAPSDPSDRQLSVRHKIDRVKFNMRHANDHLKHAREAEEELHHQGICSGDMCKAITARNTRHAMPKE